MVTGRETPYNALSPEGLPYLLASGLKLIRMRCLLAKTGHRPHHDDNGILLCGVGDERAGWPTQCDHECGQVIQAKQSDETVG